MKKISCMLVMMLSTLIINEGMSSPKKATSTITSRGMHLETEIPEVVKNYVNRTRAFTKAQLTEMQKQKSREVDIEKFDQMLETLNKKIALLQDENQKQKQEALLLREKAEILSEQTLLAESNLQELEQKYISETTSKDKLLQEMTKQRDDLQLLVNDSGTQLNMSKRAIEQYKATIENLQKDKTNLESELTHAEEEIRNVERQKKGAEDARNEGLNKWFLEDEQRDKLQREYDDLQIQFNKLKQNYDTVSKTLEDATQECEALEKSLASVLTKKKSLERTVQVLASKLQETASRI